MDRDFKGVWIPKEIWLDDRLSLNEKFYLAVYVTCRSHTETTYILSSVFSSKTADKAATSLQEKGYIKLYFTSYPDMAKEYVLNHKDEGPRCEWCKQPSLVLHSHHYPVSRANGGTEVVRICPNCHCAYHAIFKEGYDGNIPNKQE